MAKSRRSYDDDDDSSDDYAPRRGRRKRKESKPFPLWLVLVLVLGPIVLVGGYFGIKSLRKDGASQGSAEDAKALQTKILGDWIYDEGGGRKMIMKIHENDQITVEISMPNSGNSITTSYSVMDTTQNKIWIRLGQSVHDGGPVDFHIEVVSDQQLKVATSATNATQQIFTRMPPAPKTRKKG